MNPFRILLPDTPLDNLSIERSISKDRLDYRVFHETDPRAVPDEEWASCDAMLIWHLMKLPEGTINKLRNCKMIIRVGVGYDNIDVGACNRNGIPLCNIPNYGTTEVADHALALMLYLVRGIGTYEAQLRMDLVQGFVAPGAPVVRRIRGATLGAIGMGRIGTAIARRAQGFDMKVVYYDPYLPEGHELGLGIRRVKTKEELLEQADIVSIHVPLSKATEKIVGRAELARMRQGSILINIARGRLVDIDAVYEALKSGHLGAAGLDVIPEEPPRSGSPLLEAWQAREEWIKGRFILTPHAAYYSEAGHRDIRTFATEMLLDYLERGDLRNNVNPDWRKAEATRPAKAVAEEVAP